MIRNSLPLAFLVVLSSACANTRVTVPRLAPAEIDLGGVRRLAIGGFSGKGNGAVNAEVTRAIFATNRFDVLDRKNLAQLTKEQDFQISGRVSDDSAVSIGQMIGAAILLVGDVVAYDYDEQVSETTSTCTKGKNKKARCTDYDRTATAHVSVALKVLDTETGKVLAAKTMDANDSKHAQNRDVKPGPFNAEDTMLAGCVKTIADAFAAVIAPHTVQETVELLDDGDLPELERGNNMAKIGEWQKALGEYSAAAEKLPGKFSSEDQAKVYYDIGIAYGYSGDYDRGVEELKRAYALEADDRTAQQIAKIKQFKIDDALLARQQAEAQAAR